MKRRKEILGDDITLTQQLFDELKTLPEPTAENKKKLEKKYRLAWNYHSNHIEGNTLTWGQTEQLLYRKKVSGNHDKQHYDEMEAHDVAVEMIQEWAADKDRDITENDLRQLNEIILVRPFWKEAITQAGDPTRKRIIPGKYKTTPNSVELKSGEIHEYASPEETPSRMQELMKWYAETKDLDPIIKASIAHHEFTAIHPFDDGNGRVVRLWTNFILLQSGYPPLIVRSRNKEEYLSALALADAGEVDVFSNFLAKEMQWSIQLSIKAAKGESLEEPGDLEKKVQILKDQLRMKDDEVIKVERSNEVLLKIFEQNVVPLMYKVKDKCKQFDDLFKNRSFYLWINGSSGGNDIQDFIKNFKAEELKYLDHLQFEYRLEDFRKPISISDSFDISGKFGVEFHDFVYELNVKGMDKIQKFYHLDLTNDELDKVALQVANNMYAQIEESLKEKKVDPR